MIGVKHILKTAFITFFAFTLILGGYYLYCKTMESPSFQISNFEIRGNHFLQQSQVRRLAEQVVLGENIFRANIQLVSTRLSNNSWIETAAVSRKIPNSIKIKIKERIPFVKIEMTDGNVFLIDQKAFLIKKVENLEYQDIPTILLNNNTNYRVGSFLKTEEIVNCIELIEKLFSIKNPDHIVDFTAITIEEGGRYVLKTPSAYIRLSKRNLEENLNKLEIATRIINQENLQVKFIDLTFNERVILKLL